MDKFFITNEENFTKQDVSNINLDLVTSLTGLYDIDIIKSELLNCNLILLNDVHILSKSGFVGQDSGSLYIPLYMDALFKKYPNKQFDVMLEFAPTKDEIFYESWETVMGSVVKQFSVCYKGISNKLKCSEEWPNVRFHNVDIRQMYEDTSDRPFLEFIKYILIMEDHIIDFHKKLNYDKSQLNIDETFNLIVKMLDKFIYYNDKYGLSSYIIQKMYSDNKFKKYKSIKNIDMINSFTKNQIEFIIIDSDIFNKIKLLQQKNRIFIYELLMLCNYIRNMLFTLEAVLMDHYAFIRFLKILEYGGSNIIYLAGGEHIKNFKNFIQTGDHNVTYIRGTSEFDDSYYDLFNQFRKMLRFRKVRGHKVNLNIRMTKKHIKIISEIMLSDLLENVDYNNFKTVKLLRNFIKIIDSQIETNDNQIMYIFNNPNKRILNFLSSEIEQIL